MRTWALIGLLALAACGETQIEKAEREYKLAKRAGARAAELCQRGEAVTEAYLQAGDELAYQSQKGRANIECQAAQLGEANGLYNGLNGQTIDVGTAADELERRATQ